MTFEDEIGQGDGVWVREVGTQKTYFLKYISKRDEIRIDSFCGKPIQLELEIWNLKHFFDVLGAR